MVYYTYTIKGIAILLYSTIWLRRNVTTQNLQMFANTYQSQLQLFHWLPCHITPRSDSVLIDVSLWSNVFRGIAGFNHRTVTDNEIHPPTSNIIDINTVDNIRLNTSQIERERSFPENSTFIPFKITDTL